MMALLGILNPATTAFAYSESELQTFLQTNWCVECDLEGADLNNFDFCGDNLDGEQAALEGSNLDNAQMSMTFCHSSLAKISTVNTDLSYGQFFESNFSDADMNGANMTGAQFEGVWFKNTGHDRSKPDRRGCHRPEHGLYRRTWTDGTCVCSDADCSNC